MTRPVSPPVGDLLYSDIEDELRSSVRKLLNARSDWHTVLERTETSDLVDRELWRRLATELFVTALPVPEALGGAGASWREAAVIAEELGRAVAPVPFLGSSVTATAFALAAGAEELARALASGNTIAALVYPLGALSPAPDPSSLYRDGAVTAAVDAVADVAAADVLLVPIASGEVVAVDAAAAGVSLTPTVSLDMTRSLCSVELTDVPATVVADGDIAAAALSRAASITAALLASEQLGLAEWCLEATVAYLNERRQFGHLLGSYQALKHRCADLWVEISQARAVARYAAACAAADSDDLPVAAALAQAHGSTVAVHAAEEAVQLHGGVAFTWEFPVHLRLKRARADALAGGAADRHRSALAELVGLPAGSAR